MYELKLIADIEEYINEELKDSLYYSELAKQTDSNLAKEILIELSKDEKCHAESFKQAYYYLTRITFMEKPIKAPSIPNFQEALKLRILSETKDYKKYGEHYLDAPNKYFRDLFFMTRTSEAEHAMRIPILFEEL